MNKGKITLLGTGTSSGVPMIGCDCEVCRSKDPRDSRLRCSAYVQYAGFNILIDCGPDFRQQVLNNNLKEFDCVLLTHQHKDHTGGLDDVRSLNYFTKKPFSIYAEPRVLEGLKLEYSYAFAKEKYPGVPEFDIHLIDSRPFTLHKTIKAGKMLPNGETAAKDTEISLEITPIRVYHYKLPILGFRIGNLVYITDAKTIPEEEFSKLEGASVAFLNCIRYTEHISHLSLPQAIDIFRRIGAKRNILTHLSHQIGTHAQLTSYLKTLQDINVEAGYDGQVIEF